MRYDLNILWVEDTETYFEETKEILEGIAEEEGITINFEYIRDGNEFFEKFKNNEKGFKLYDIFFIDYSLSSGIVGSQLIADLRMKKFNSDILFYSSDKEDEIRKIIEKNMGSYEGVYVANRESFDDKSYLLISKNARRLTSLSNIRGYLMDQTSENDFTVQSYIRNKYDQLNDEQKQEISDMLLQYIKEKREKFDKKAEDQIKELEDGEIKNIGKVMKLGSELFPIRLKYEMFKRMLDFDEELSFENVTIEQYLGEIVKARNTLAHKKLDVCKTQEYILYYDTIKQLVERKCPEDCNYHNDENKISLDRWNELRKKIQSFGYQIDDVQKSIK